MGERILRHLLLIILLIIGLPVNAALDENVEFRTIQSRDGLSNGKINGIFKDTNGFVWFATESGLDRYDGFRFRNFLFDNNDEHSLANNTVQSVQQDFTGDLWVRTSVGYCIYNYQMEKFDRHPENWMQSVGMKGTPEYIYIDGNKDMWFNIYGKGLYFLSHDSMKPYLFQASKGRKNTIPIGSITNMTNVGKTVVVTYNDGTMIRLDGRSHKIMWVNTYLKKLTQAIQQPYITFVDPYHNYWVGTIGKSYVYSSLHKKWFDSIGAFLTASGIKNDLGSILIKDVKVDHEGRVWIATDHEGLMVVNQKTKKLLRFKNSPFYQLSLPDNTVQSLYVDNLDGIWIGTYKNGVAYYSPRQSRFQTIYLGDVCTIAEDHQGRLWCGTNETGIVVYDRMTGQTRDIYKTESGLGSDVVVSSLCASDGSLYFGTFNGGMARYKDGVWKVFRNDGKPGSLINDNVWSLTEDKFGNIIIGTLGSGVQIMDPKTNLCVTYNMMNSTLNSDYISSVSITPKGNIAIGHSMNFSVMDVRSKEITSYSTTRSGKPFLSPSVNQMIIDSREIVWTATPSGIAMYDRSNDQQQCLNDINGTQGMVGCSVVEDLQHNIWCVSDHIVSRVKVSKNADGQWDFFMTSFNYLDGLQDKQFNYRSILRLKNGDIAIGGQEGVNIIRPSSLVKSKIKAHAIFSGMLLFDRYIGAGDEYDGRQILEEALDRCREVSLRDGENAFTIQLASDVVQVPTRSRFLYRMQGFSDKWMMTSEGQPAVTFTNLRPGKYTLQVKVVNGDGSINDDVSELEIEVNPPFYLSVWTNVCYLILFVLVAYLYRKRALRRQRAKLDAEHRATEARRKEELDELRLNFFTNISHELRTPLTLILSPITSMINEETDEAKKTKMQLIQRNANRLLTLVNEVLDFRKVDKKEEQLNPMMGDIVDYVGSICNSFKVLAGKGITLTFKSSMSVLTMLFDADKLNKIISNLLSNAYKFTPQNGKITVGMEVVLKDPAQGRQEDMIQISVADTGCGIPDADKKKIFDRFYQVDGTKMQPYGGSGIGLNLVANFVKLHDGTIEVKDNPEGGTIFVVLMPIRFDVSKPQLKSQEVEIPAETSKEMLDGAPLDSKEAKDDINLFDALPAASDMPTSMDEPADEAEETPAEVEHPELHHEDREKPVVLLVDDSDDFRAFMRSELIERYNVVEAVDGVDGWEKAQKTEPDIVLSDVMMPKMDGNAFCRLMKGDNRMSAIPFLMLTARLTQEQRIEGLESGADEYITKPFNLDVLRLRMENLIKWRQRGSAQPAQPAQQSAEGAPQEKPEEQQPVKLSAMDEQLLHDIRKYIDTNLSDEDMSVESLSAALNMSRVQLYRRMVSLTGSTPSEYIRTFRLERAEKLLHDKDHTVSEIAYRVGFNNPRYFTKYFTDAYGMTPSQYRKKFL